jgi:hypothetical protein
MDEDNEGTVETLGHLEEYNASPKRRKPLLQNSRYSSMDVIHLSPLPRVYQTVSTTHSSGCISCRISVSLRFPHKLTNLASLSCFTPNSRSFRLSFQRISGLRGTTTSQPSVGYMYSTSLLFRLASAPIDLASAYGSLFPGGYLMIKMGVDRAHQ